MRAGLETETNIFTGRADGLFRCSATECTPQAVRALFTWLVNCPAIVVASLPDGRGALVTRFNRVGDENHGAIGHENVSTTLVTATRRSDPDIVVPTVVADFRVRRTNRVNTGHRLC